MFFRTLCVYLSLLLLFFGNVPIQAENTVKNDKQLWLTIFVHGIISVKPFLSPYNVCILMLDDINNSLYAKTIKQAREDSFFHHYHAMQGLGLQKIDTTTIKKGAGASAFARTYDTLARHINNDASIKNRYYTYGWSGLLSKKVWQLEAQTFYNILQKTIAAYHAQGMYPKIRIIGYSHGGSIALQLANVKKESQAVPLHINELVAIGMPAAPDALQAIKSPLFGKVYHIYSYGDRVQTIDIFSLNVLLSERTFSGTRRNPLPTKLHQIGLRMFRLSSACIKKCKHGHGKTIAPPRHVRKVHPGHTELWSFGWTDSGYRHYFPLNPLPMAAYTPWHLHMADSYAAKAKHISLDMHPYCDTAIVTTHGKQKKQATEKFIKASMLETLKQDALAFRLDNLNDSLYAEHIQLAGRKAQNKN